MVNPKKFIDTGVYTLMGDLWPDISVRLQQQMNDQ